MAAHSIPSVLGLGSQLQSGSTTVKKSYGPFAARTLELNGRFRAFSHVRLPSDDVLATLDAELRAGKKRGLLHGIAASVKGCIPVAGMPWTEGSQIYADRTATHDAVVVAKLRKAGALIFGTTTLSELAMYGTTNSFEPMGLNPWDIERTAGGSSTGAGVAASLAMALVNVGTDSGGSIRNPACHCGVVGFMPGIGAISNAGVPPHVPALTSTGLIGRTVEDVSVAFRVLSENAGADADPSLRLLVPQRLVEQMCDEDTQTLFRTALAHVQKAGVALLPSDVPEWLPAEAAAGIISLYESGIALRAMDLSLATPGLRDRYRRASLLTEFEIETARRDALAFKAAVKQALTSAKADGFLTPCWPFAAPRIDAEVVHIRGKTVSVDPHRNCFVRAANAMDGTAVTIPMGVYPDVGIPAGLHLLSAAGSEMRLLAVARLLEQAIPAIPLPPPLRQ